MVGLQTIKSVFCIVLMSLGFFSNTLDASPIEALSPGDQEIQRLCDLNRPIRDDDLKEMEIEDLTSLDLEGQGVTNEGVKLLANHIENFAIVEILDLSSASITDEALPHIIKILDTLAPFPHFNSFYLYPNSLSEESREEISAHATTYAYSISLEEDN